MEDVTRNARMRTERVRNNNKKKLWNQYNQYTKVTGIGVGLKFMESVVFFHSKHTHNTYLQTILIHVCIKKAMLSRKTS